MISYLILIPIFTQTIKTVLLVRSEKVSLSTYQSALATQIFYRSPQQMLPEIWQQNRLSESQIEGIMTYMKQASQKELDSGLKQKIMKIPISYETFAIINKFNQTVNSNAFFDPINCEQVDKLIRKLRQQPGGEDAVVLVNGKPWRCQDLEPDKWIYVIIYSSAWAPSRFFNRAKFFTTFLEFFKPDPWVNGAPNNYEWNSVMDVDGIQRSILWSEGELVHDNWTDEYSLQNKGTKPKFIWLKWGAIFGLGLFLGWLLF